jgi:hypothetical protein
VPQSPSDAAGQAPVLGRAVSSRVAQLNIRRDGYTVTAELTCHVCCGDGRVEKPGYHVDATCGACNGKGYRVLESTRRVGRFTVSVFWSTWRRPRLDYEPGMGYAHLQIGPLRVGWEPRR